jgi:ABC-type sugar transport system permease subunit
MILSISYEVITLLLIVLIVSLILSIIFKNKEKKDKGAVFFYYKLIYRRKMIRTLWTFAVVVISLVAIYRFAGLSSNENLIISTSFLILFLIQLIYNYLKWKKYEK